MSEPAADPQASGNEVWAEFAARYRNDPVGFVEHVLGATPDPWQAEALAAVAAGERRLSIRSGHGVGKSTFLAWLAVWACCVFPAAKVIQTAPSGPQLWDALFAETKTWFKRLPGPLFDLFDIQRERIEHRGAPEEIFVSARTSRAENPEAMQGVHADAGIVILMPDEASGIAEAVFEAAAGSMSGHNCVTVLTGNPTRTSGFFFDTHHSLRSMWWTKRVSCEDSSRVSRDFLADMAARYGEDSNAYRVRVLGEFPQRGDDTLISLELAEAAMRREIELDPKALEVWGLDVARFGNDSSALCKRRGKVVVEPVRSWKNLDLMQTVGRVKAEYDAAAVKPASILVDVIGIGSGVVDRLRELGLPVRGINVSEAPSLGGNCLNLRAELWCKARDWLEARDCKLPLDQDLTAELTTPRYKFSSTGKLQVESKDEMRKRRVKSPDLADSFVLTFADDAAVAGGGFSSLAWNKPLRRGIKGVV